MRARVAAAFAALVLAIGMSAFVIAPSDAGDVTELFAHSQEHDILKFVPALLNYQGYLATADSGVVNETLQMTFRFFDSSTGGTQLWAETHPAVEVKNGGFTLLLGSVTPFPADLFDGSILYLQMEVGTEAFTPRKTIVSVAYSLRSDAAAHADSSGYASIAGHAASADIASETLHTVQADTAGYATSAGHAVRSDTASYSPGTGSWIVSGEDVYRLTGNVGLGTDSPTAKLDVVGNVDADGFTINGTPIGTSTDTYWNKTGSNIHYSAGNVGVGTATPTARLQVEGDTGNKSSMCTSDHAVWGEHSSGMKGSIGSADGGVTGQHPNDGNEGRLGGQVAGVEGYSDTDIAVFGEHCISGNVGWLGVDDRGAYGYNASTGNYGLLGGEASHDAGVYGLSNSSDGAGVYGFITGSANYGLLANSDFSVYGQNGSGSFGYLGAYDYGAGGEHADGHKGYLGTNEFGVLGQNDNGNWGYSGGSDYGTYGHHMGSGNYGVIGSVDFGAYGHNHASDNRGFLGGSGTWDYGAYGAHASSGNFGILGTSSNGVRGRNSNGNEGSLGNTYNAVYGANDNGNEGVLGHADFGVGGWNQDGSHCKLGIAGGAAFGENGVTGTLAALASGTSGVAGSSSSSAQGALGYLDYGVYGDDWTSGGLAGYFTGPVTVQGHLTKTSGSFRIDHPLDPENKYLYHSLVESPDMMNIYNGTAILDDGGEAWIQLPEWFEALNRDFRYQLTAIGAPGPDLYVANEISGNRFRIAGGKPGMKVSWQVTGIRQDPWAEAHRVPVEKDKPPEERGYYLHPELYSQPEERGIPWNRYPNGLSLMEEMIAAQKRASEHKPGIGKIGSHPEVRPQILELPLLPPAEMSPAIERSPKDNESLNGEVR